MSLQNYAIDDTDFDLYAEPRLSRTERYHRVQRLANLLDSAIEIPFLRMRIGLDGVIGLVPGIGDAASAALSLWFVREARALGAPAHIIARMLGNIAVDAAIGAVPLLGDAFDFVFKANLRNVRLLRRWLEREGVLRDPFGFD